jgi:outer membrane protein assembly factor BamB
MHPDYHLRLLLGVLVVGALAVAVVILAGGDAGRLAMKEKPAPIVRSSGARAAAPAAGTVPAVPPEVAQRADSWPLPNGDYQNTRSARGSSIDSSTVGALGLAWQVPLEGASKWGAAASGPLIIGGVVYFQDLLSNVWALDLATGRPRWVHRFRQKAFGPNGPAVGWGKVFVQDGKHNIVALNMSNGGLTWRTPLAGPTGQQQPTVFGGMVLTGIAAGLERPGSGKVLKTALLKGGASGYAFGIDEATGLRVWQLRTVEKGFWGNPGVNGGAGIWGTPALDPASGMTFWSTGNPGPAPGTVAYPNASSRPGRNLYSNTVLALDARTGHRKWFYQALPHDIFHHDLQNAPILVDAGGRKLVIASGKMGVVYAIDRETGHLAWKRPVGVHQNDTLSTLPHDKVVTVYPGFWGGIEVPGAYAQGTLYYQVENLSTPYTDTAWDSADGEQSVENLEGRTQYDTGTSEVDAIDAATGRVRWTTALPAVGFGGATVVNDLVLTATYDGMLYALRRSDGKIVWRFPAPGGIIAWPAVSGDSIVWPVGLGMRPVLLALRIGAAGAAVKPQAQPRVVPAG